MAYGLQIEVDYDVAMQTPERFRIGERQVDVIEVLDRWPGREHSYIKLRGSDGVYILRYDAPGRRWALTLFDSGRLPETRLSST